MRLVTWHMTDMTSPQYKHDNSQILSWQWTSGQCWWWIVTKMLMWSNQDHRWLSLPFLPSWQQLTQLLWAHWPGNPRKYFRTGFLSKTYLCLNEVDTLVASHPINMYPGSGSPGATCWPPATIPPDSCPWVHHTGTKLGWVTCLNLIWKAHIWFHGSLLIFKWFHGLYKPESDLNTSTWLISL